MNMKHGLKQMQYRYAVLYKTLSNTKSFILLCLMCLHLDGEQISSLQVLWSAALGSNLNGISGHIRLHVNTASVIIASFSRISYCTVVRTTHQNIWPYPIISGCVCYSLSTKKYRISGSSRNIW